MDAQAISEVFATKPKGSIFQITVKRPCKCYKGITDVVEKESHYQGQFTDYSRRAAVREAVEAGERDAPELPSYVEESFFVGDVRFWRGKEKDGKPGQEYFPMPVTGNKAKVTWYLNGESCNYDAVEAILTAADKIKEQPTKEELAGKGQVPFNAIKLENIVAIG